MVELFLGFNDEPTLRWNFVLPISDFEISYAPDLTTAAVERYLVDYSSRGLNKYDIGLTLRPEVGYFILIVETYV